MNNTFQLEIKNNLSGIMLSKYKNKSILSLKDKATIEMTKHCKILHEFAMNRKFRREIESELTVYSSKNYIILNLTKLSQPEFNLCPVYCLLDTQKLKTPFKVFIQDDDYKDTEILDCLKPRQQDCYYDWQIDNIRIARRINNYNRNLKHNKNKQICRYLKTVKLYADLTTLFHEENCQMMARDYYLRCQKISIDLYVTYFFPMTLREIFEALYGSSQVNKITPNQMYQLGSNLSKECLFNRYRQKVLGPNGFHVNLYDYEDVCAIIVSLIKKKVIIE
jgi:hypothetical protein